MKRIIFFISCVVFLSSCIPGKIAVTPGLNGKITDLETHAPVSKAKVYFQNNPQVSTDTDSEGYFKLLPLKKWALVVIMGVPVDFAPPRDRLIIDATGFLSKKTYPIYGSYGEKLKWLNIELERMNKDTSLSNGSTRLTINQAPNEP
ncbi:MAG: hypothetical protein ABIK92_09935 [Pseudomonadota bacterium]